MKVIFSKHSFFALFIVLFVYSCKKDKVPVIPVEKKLIYERISGHYKVYDTNLVFLYEMDLEYVVRQNNELDSIRFKNFNNNFNYSKFQSTDDNFDFSDQKYISVTSPFPTKGKNNKSFSIFSKGDSIYDNNWRNDTIRLCFEIHNTPWWLQEMVPYVSRIEKQIAVKQH